MCNYQGRELGGSLLHSGDATQEAEERECVCGGEVWRGKGKVGQKREIMIKETERRRVEGCMRVREG